MFYSTFEITDGRATQPTQGCVLHPGRAIYSLWVALPCLVEAAVVQYGRQQGRGNFSARITVCFTLLFEITKVLVLHSQTQGLRFHQGRAIYRL
jgi:hypothetical protein